MVPTMSNIFNNDSTNVETPNLDLNFEDLVGEGKKYADQNQLARAYANADHFIEQSKQKETEYKVRTELLEAEVNRLREAANTPKPSESLTPPVGTPPSNEAVKPNEVDLSKLVQSEIEAANEKRNYSSNIDRAAKTLEQVYGSPEQANAAVRKRAQELGLSTEWLMDVAGKSPDALFATMGINPKSNTSSSTPFHQNDGNIRNMNPNSGKRGYSYFQELRKTSPKQYFAPATQREMFEARKTLGDDFYTV